MASGGVIAFTVLSGGGFVALAAAVLIGFEEADPVLLLVAAGLLAGAPAAVLGRIAVTSELTREEKRLWLRALTGRKALQAWAVYLASSHHRAALAHLARRSARGGA